MKTLARNIIRGETERYSVSTAAGQEWSPENAVLPASGYKISGGSTSGLDSAVSRLNIHTVIRMDSSPPALAQLFKSVRSDSSTIFFMYSAGTALYLDLYPSSASVIYAITSFGSLTSTADEWAYMFVTAKNDGTFPYQNINGVETTINNTNWNGQTVDFTQTASFDLLGGPSGTPTFDIKRIFISTNSSLDFSNSEHRSWFVDENSGRLRIPDTSRPEISDALVYMGDTQKAGTSFDGRNFNSGYNMGVLNTNSVTGTVTDVTT